MIPSSHLRASHQTADTDSSSTLPTSRQTTSVHPRPHDPLPRSQNKSGTPPVSLAAPAPHPPEFLLPPPHARRSPRTPSRRIKRYCPFAAACGEFGSFTRSKEYLFESRQYTTGISARSQKLSKFLLRRIGHYRRIVLRRIRKRPRRRSRQMIRIRVCEQQPIARRRAGSQPRSVILPHPARRQPTRFQDVSFLDPRAPAPLEFARPVARLVVHHDHLADLRLRGHRLDRARDRCFFVPCGNDGGNQLFWNPIRAGLLYCSLGYGRYHVYYRSLGIPD